jgi:hypothetical protein
MDEYEVGYRKPPKSGQIKPGEVRNPHGRAGKKPTNKPATTELDLLEQIEGETVIIDGRAMTRREATIRAHYMNAMKGKPNSIRYIERLGERLDTEGGGGGVLVLPCDDPERWNAADALAQHKVRVERQIRNAHRRERRARVRPPKEVAPLLKPAWQILADLENEIVVHDGKSMSMRELRLRLYLAHAVKNNRAAQNALANIQGATKLGEKREAGYLMVPPPMTLDAWSRMAAKQQAKYREPLKIEE